jgi:2-aminophenol/2-amino-5-chlorophenol 1,6-dioxygenase subunit alpha
VPLVSAFLVPGSPLPYLRAENPPWAGIASGYRAAARGLSASRPETILLYSTQWLAVLDELWQTRPSLTDTHIDENWYEYGDLDYDIRIDTELASACVAGSREIGITSKAVVANGFLNPGNRLPLTLASNNLYHGFEDTIRLAEMAVKKADSLNRRVAVVGVGGLSGSIFRQEIDIRNDGIATAKDDTWNRRILALIERGAGDEIISECEAYAKEAKVDMRFKHFAWVFGALGRRFSGARIHAYGATYGAGAAVIEFKM